MPAFAHEHDEGGVSQRERVSHALPALDRSDSLGHSVAGFCFRALRVARSAVFRGSSRQCCRRDGLDIGPGRRAPDDGLESGVSWGDDDEHVLDDACVD